MSEPWIKIPDDWCIWTFNKHSRVACPCNLTADAWHILMQYDASFRTKGDLAFFAFKNEEEAIHFKLTHL